MPKKVSEEIRSSIILHRENEGFTLYDLVAKFGLSRSTIFEIIRNCNNSKVKRAAPHRKVVESIIPMKRPDLSKVDLGEAARQMIAARLMLAGVQVFRPMTEDTAIDLLVLSSLGKPLKCQCKYLYYPKNGSGCHVLSLSASRSNRKGAVAHDYTADEVDFFLGYCQDNDAVYVIPFSICRGRGGLNMWILRKPQGKNDNESFDCSEWKSAFHLLRD
ncbi:MAG: group I intron-associated PD-(D/E)XK endonuclease [Bacteroidota bacterium]|jgi:hypothetical protein